MDVQVALEAVTKKFGLITAVDDLSFSVKKGEVLGFLGPNGAGKSTAMRMLCGFLVPTAGRIVVCGHDVVTSPIEAKKMIGYMPEGAPSYGDMTPPDFLSFIADIRGLSGAYKKERVDFAIKQAALERVLSQPIDTLSKGYTRRVGLAQAILHDPAVLVLDEPTEGLDPNQKHHVRNMIRALAEEKTIIISTHILEEVSAICSRAVIIDQGRLVADDAPTSLKKTAAGHNRIHVSLSSSVDSDFISKLNKLNGVSKVISFDLDAGDILIQPTKTTPIPMDDLLAFFKKEGVTAHKIFAKEGRLEEVFRSLTTSDTDEALNV